jgi:autotransporter-associated beta strand protein
MVLKTASVPAPYLTLGAANALKNMIADNADIVFTTKTARPSGGLIARNSATVLLADSGNYVDAGAGKKYTFTHGSVLSAFYNLASENRVEYVFDGSTLETPLYDKGMHDGQNYFNFLTLRNGAKATGHPLRCGSGQDAVYGTWTYVSDGIGTNRLDAGINLVNTITGAQNSTLVIDTETDLVVSGVIRDYTGRAGTGILKRGDATLTLVSGGNTWVGGMVVEAGVLAIAPGASAGSGMVTVKSGAALKVPRSGAVDLSTSVLNVESGATLAFNFTDKVSVPSLTLNAGSLLPSVIDVKVAADVADMKLSGRGKYVLTSGCDLTGKTVNVIDKPSWVASVVVNADGNLQLMPRVKGLVISVH